MNPKYALGFLVAVLAIVSQLVGEDSAISSVANSDKSELQQAMRSGEATATQAISSNREITTTKIEPTRSDSTSLRDFYEDDEMEAMSIPEDGITDEDPNADQVAFDDTAVATPATIGTKGRPVEPWATSASADVEGG